MKIAISTDTYFAEAIIGLLSDADYEFGSFHNEGSYILVNTSNKTAKTGITTGDRTVYSPTSQWAAIAALVNATDGGALAAAPASTVCVTGHHRAAAASVALPAPAAIIPVDFAGNLLAVGDTVLVISPSNSKPQFVLRTDGVAVITRITAKGALGFAFDEDNEFLSKRFQKVTVAQVVPGDYYNIQSGDLVVARPGKHSRSAENAAKFTLPTDTALVFRGVTVDKGNFILDGYAEHQYSPKRFSVVTPVLAN